MKMGEQHVAGFTIIEVLIVIAISGAILLAAILAVSGKQNDTEFVSSAQQIRQQIQGAITNVQTGQYPPSDTLGLPQGTQTNDIFLGEVLQFGINGPGAQQIQQYTVIGSRLTMSGQVADTYHDAQAQLTPANNSAGTSTFTTYGLTISTPKMWYCPAYLVNPLCTTKIKIGGVAILSSLNGATSGGGLDSGKQSLVIVPLVTVNLGDLPAITGNSTAININTALGGAGGACNPFISHADDFANCEPNSVRWCFNSGTTNQSAFIYTTFNGAGVGLKIFSTPDCPGA